MTLGLIPTMFLLFTLAGIIGIVLHRTLWCKFWRSDEYDRRKEQADIDGPDRRRRERGTAADRK